MLLTYGIDPQTGELKHIDDVANGEACGCICPSCESPLCAKQGTVLEHHFAHVRAECSTAFESSVHLAAKAALVRSKTLWLPTLHVHYEGQFKSVDQTIFSAQTVTFEEVREEVTLGEIKTDVLMKQGTVDLAVEIAVTHHVDAIKLDKICRLNLAAVEIDLSSFKTLPSIDILAQWFEAENPYVHWLYSPKLEHAYEAAEANDQLSPQEHEANRNIGIATLQAIREKIEAMREPHAPSGVISDDVRVSSPPPPTPTGALRVRAIRLSLTRELDPEVHRLEDLSRERELTDEESRWLTQLRFIQSGRG